MNRWKKVAAGAVALMVASGAGAAWAGGPEPDGSGGSPAPGPVTRALGAGTTETDFVPITPCRLLDTRFGTPKPAVGAERALKVRGSGAQFAAQGGTAGGCGIPAGATAIEASVTAAAPTGVGFLRVYPGTAPNATFLNYTANEATTNTGAVRICSGICLVNNDLRFKVFGTSTDVVMDVQGYYTAPIAATVNANGSLGRSSRTLSATKTTTGKYTVVFDRNVTSCAFSGTIGFPVPAGTLNGEIQVQYNAADDNAAFVSTHDSAGTLADRPFNVEVIC